MKRQYKKNTQSIIKYQQRIWYCKAIVAYKQQQPLCEYIKKVVSKIQDETYNLTYVFCEILVKYVANISIEYIIFKNKYIDTVLFIIPYIKLFDEIFQNTFLLRYKERKRKSYFKNIPVYKIKLQILKFLLNKSLTKRSTKYQKNYRIYIKN